MTEIVPAEPWSLSSIGLTLSDPDLPFSEFEQVCFVLGAAHQAVRFAIGDALVAGEELYGQLAFQAFEALNLTPEAMKDYRRVSERVPRSIRRKPEEGVSWSHHRAVAALPPAEQREWLERVADEGLSHHALRDALRNGSEPKAEKACRCCGRTF